MVEKNMSTETPTKKEMTEVDKKNLVELLLCRECREQYRSIYMFVYGLGKVYTKLAHEYNFKIDGELRLRHLYDDHKLVVELPSLCVNYDSISLDTYSNVKKILNSVLVELNIHSAASEVKRIFKVDVRDIGDDICFDVAAWVDRLQQLISE